MKLCRYVGKLRSSQPTLKPMNVKIKLHSDWYNVKMDYYEWMQYLHDEIQKYEYKTSPMYWCNYAEIHNQFTYDKNAKNK